MLKFEPCGCVLEFRGIRAWGGGGARGNTCSNWSPDQTQAFYFFWKKVARDTLKLLLLLKQDKTRLCVELRGPRASQPWGTIFPTEAYSSLVPWSLHFHCANFITSPLAAHISTACPPQNAMTVSSEDIHERRFLTSPGWPESTLTRQHSSTRKQIQKVWKTPMSYTYLDWIVIFYQTIDKELFVRLVSGAT